MLSETLDPQGGLLVNGHFSVFALLKASFGRQTSFAQAKLDQMLLAPFNRLGAVRTCFVIGVLEGFLRLSAPCLVGVYVFRALRALLELNPFKILP